MTAPEDPAAGAVRKRVIQLSVRRTFALPADHPPSECVAQGRDRNSHAGVRSAGAQTQPARLSFRYNATQRNATQPATVTNNVTG